MKLYRALPSAVERESEWMMACIRVERTVKPSGTDLPALPSEVESVLEMVRMRDEHLEYLRLAASDTGAEVSAEDYLVVATLRRSLDNIDGFLAMVAGRNISCGEAIIRLQLDTAMTLFARTLMADVFDFVSHLAEGGHRRHYRDRDGQLLADAYLHRQLTRKHEETSDIYGRTSGFIHFSQRHMERVLDIEATRRADHPVFKGVEHLTAGWNDEQACSALVSFLWATEAILAECADWRATRRVQDGRSELAEGPQP
jgi:hypothetical protein